MTRPGGRIKRPSLRFRPPEVINVPQFQPALGRVVAAESASAHRGPAGTGQSISIDKHVLILLQRKEFWYVLVEKPRVDETGRM